MIPITDDFQGHLGLATVITMGLEVLKQVDFPGVRWINEKRPGAIMALSAVGSFMVSMGFQWTWESSWPSLTALLQNGGTVHFSASIPSLDTLLRAVGQFAMNYATYHGVVKPASTMVKTQIPGPGKANPPEPVAPTG